MRQAALIHTQVGAAALDATPNKMWLKHTHMALLSVDHAWFWHLESGKICKHLERGGRARSGRALRFGTPPGAVRTAGAPCMALSILHYGIQASKPSSGGRTVQKV